MFCPSLFWKNDTGANCRSRQKTHQLWMKPKEHTFNFLVWTLTLLAEHHQPDAFFTFSMGLIDSASPLQHYGNESSTSWYVGCWKASVFTFVGGVGSKHNCLFSLDDWLDHDPHPDQTPNTCIPNTQFPILLGPGSQSTCCITWLPGTWFPGCGDLAGTPIPQPAVPEPGSC